MSLRIRSRSARTLASVDTAGSSTDIHDYTGQNSLHTQNGNSWLARALPWCWARMEQGAPLPQFHCLRDSQKCAGSTRRTFAQAHNRDASGNFGKQVQIKHTTYSSIANSKSQPHSRTTIQQKGFGPRDAPSPGMIPKHCIISLNSRNRGRAVQASHAIQAAPRGPQQFGPWPRAQQHTPRAQPAASR